MGNVLPKSGVLPVLLLTVGLALVGQPIGQAFADLDVVTSGTADHSLVAAFMALIGWGVALSSWRLSSLVWLAGIGLGVAGVMYSAVAGLLALSFVGDLTAATVASTVALGAAVPVSTLAGVAAVRELVSFVEDLPA